MIVGPFPATNDTDAPPICALVTVTTCAPTAGDNVHWTDDYPLLSVVDVVALSDPPPTTVHLSETPLTDFPAAVEHAHDERRIERRRHVRRLVVARHDDDRRRRVRNRWASRGRRGVRRL